MHEHQVYMTEVVRAVFFLPLCVSVCKISAWSLTVQEMFVTSVKQVVKYIYVKPCFFLTTKLWNTVYAHFLDISGYDIFYMLWFASFKAEKLQNIQNVHLQLF